MTQNGRITQGTLRTTAGVDLPLDRTDVDADVRGPVATVRVRQVFRNTGAEAVEVVYSFPLPHAASVFEMVMRIGTRAVRGVVKEKEEAKRAFEKARSEGRVASLLEQSRPDLFTLSATNVAPGAEVDVTIAYQERLVFDDGAWRFVFPMVAPERYLPTPPNAGVTAASGVRPPRVPSGERSADVSLEVRVHDRHLAPPQSPSHRIEVETRGEGGNVIRLHPSERLPNRDFVLALGDGRRGVRTEAFFEREKGRPGAFLLVVRPPDVAPEALAGVARASSSEAGRPIACGNCGGPLRVPEHLVERPGIGPSWRCPYCGIIVAATTDAVTSAGDLPRDVVFLVDRSASMRGGALALAGRAVARVIEELDPEDAVQIFAFDHERVAFDGRGDDFVRRDDAPGKRVAAFFSGLGPRGGTERSTSLTCLPPTADPRRSS